MIPPAPAKDYSELLLSCPGSLVELWEPVKYLGTLGKDWPFNLGPWSQRFAALWKRIPMSQQLLPSLHVMNTAESFFSRSQNF